MVGPRGPPGESFITGLAEIDEEKTDSLIMKLSELKTFVGEKGDDYYC